MNRPPSPHASAFLEIVWEGTAGRYEARTSDLSEGGCFVDTRGQASAGEEIAFRLLLPAGGWLELRGEVTYQYPHMGFGVRFTGASDEDRKRLAWLVRAEGLKAGGVIEATPAAPAAAISMKARPPA